MALPLPITGQPVDMLLDSTNDLVIGVSDASWAYDLAGVTQLCRIAVQIFRDEWFADLDVGIEYYDGILGAKADLGVSRARAAFRRELLAVPGVIAVLKLDVTFDGKTRNMSVSWIVRTALGDTPPDVLTKRVALT